MRVFVLGSGSTGNSLIVEASGTRLLVDAGFGPRSSARRLRSLGEDLFPRGVDGILITHQHADHIAHLEPLVRALRAPIYFHRGIEAKRIRHRYDVRSYDAGDTLRIGALSVQTIDVPHDAPQIALGIRGGGASFGIATDLGEVPDTLVDLFSECDAALFEANHCPKMLAVGPYPERLRQRVAGPVGHLANEQTAAAAARLRGTRLARLYLGHISRANNSSARALAVVRASAPHLVVDALEHGEPSYFRVEEARIPRRLGGTVRSKQMDLPFGA